MYHRKPPIPSEEDISERAHLIWEREGRPEGKSEEHWLRAKAELALEFEEERTAAMPFRKQPVPSDESIRARANMIWEREGRPEGKAEVHWLRAKAELEDEFHAECAAYVEGKPATYVLPLLEISSPPALTTSSIPAATFAKYDGALSGPVAQTRRSVVLTS
jgi:hypothetical protein